MRFLGAGILIFAPIWAVAESRIVPDSPNETISPPFVPSSYEEIPPVPSPPSPPDLAADLFRAVAAADTSLVGQFLDAGADVNANLVLPPPNDLLERFKGTSLDYYLREEKGLTPLMLASAMGYPDVVRLLLERGANRNALTKKHRTFALWLAGRNGHIEVMQLLLGRDPESDGQKIRISITEQTAWLWKGETLARTMRISTGRKKFPTPKGRFVVTDKYRDWKSTLYPARMPYFLRLSCKDFGMHAGVVPGYPASHGCIRLPLADAKALFAEVPLGTVVEIE